MSFPPPTTSRHLEETDVRPWMDLRDTGLLWLINSAVLHPRGFALGITSDGSGWTLEGDGCEPWVMPADDLTDERFAQVEALFNECRAKPVGDRHERY